MLDIRPEPAETPGYRLAAFGMRADRTRQREQTERRFEIDVRRLQPARDRHPFRLLAILGLAELDVEPVGAFLDGNALAAFRIGAEHGFGGTGIALGLSAADPERPRVAAFRVVRAADECAEAAK